MADNPRTQDAMNSDPAALRRRARRRLVGAIAIALMAVLVVPMLFDPDPKPLGSDVDIRIPAQETPFNPATPAGQAQAVPAGQTGTAPGAAAMSEPPVEQAPATPPKAAEPTPTSPPPKTVVKASPANENMAGPAPVPAKEANKEAAKPEKPEPAPKAESAFASKGYYLQLGAFGSEANARTLLTKVQAAGFKAGMADSNGQYRVRVGPIQDRDKALDTLAKLKAKGFSPVIIGP